GDRRPAGARLGCGARLCAVSEGPRTRGEVDHGGGGGDRAMRRTTRDFLTQAGMTKHQINRLSSDEIGIVDAARIAGVTPDELSYASDHGLLVNATGARKLADLAMREGTTRPETVRAVLDQVGYEEALSRQQRRGMLFMLSGPRDPEAPPSERRHRGEGRV